MRAKLRDRAGIASVFGQLFVEQALYTPFVFYPVYVAQPLHLGPWLHRLTVSCATRYYITKTAINGDREQMEAAGQGVVEYALRQCRANFADDWKATAAIFVRARRPTTLCRHVACSLRLSPPSPDPRQRLQLHVHADAHAYPLFGYVKLRVLHPAVNDPW